MFRKKQWLCSCGGYKNLEGSKLSIGKNIIDSIQIPNYVPKRKLGQKKPSPL